ncbi:MAG: ComEC/Rec2 family competence protein [Bacteroidales bacterium]|nr:ComEC/Rec2 family competence protein [Bacteroidales bacterium]
MSRLLDKVPFLVPLLMLLAAMAAKQWGIGIWTGIVSILLAVVYIPFIAHSDTTKKIQSFRAMSWPVIALFFFGISLVALSFHESKLPEENARQQGSRIAGYIEEKTARERGIRLLVRVEDYVNTNGDRAMPFSIFVYTDSADMQVGDKISLPAIIDWYGGNIRRLDDYETAMMRRGVLGSLSTSSQGIRKYHSEDRVIPPPAVMRERISRAIGGAGLSSQSVVLLRMLLIGDKSDTTADFRQQLAYSGLSHVFALSGMHLAIIASLFLWILLPLNLILPSKVRYVVAIFLIFAYCYLVGMPWSTLRAAIMMSFMLMSMLFERRASSFNALCAAAFFILLWSPQAIGDVAFQLSFFCVLCLIAYSDTLHFIDFKEERSVHKLLSFLLTMLVATLGSWALVAYHFGSFTPAFAITNLFVLPFLPAYVFAGILYLLASQVGIDIPMLGTVIDFSSKFITTLAQRFGSSPLGVFHFRPHLFTLFAWMAGFLAIGIWLSSRRHIEVWKQKGATPAYFRILPCAGALSLVVAILSMFYVQTASERAYMTFERHTHLPSLTYHSPEGRRVKIPIEKRGVTSLDIHGERVVILNSNRYSRTSRNPAHVPSEPQVCDHLVVCTGFRGYLTDILRHYRPRVIIDARMSVPTATSFKSEASSLPTGTAYFYIGDDSRYLKEY